LAGLNLGGNYYTNFSNTGYSRACSDLDNNGICDATITLGPSNIDYFALTTQANNNLTDAETLPWQIRSISCLMM